MFRWLTNIFRRPSPTPSEASNAAPDLAIAAFDFKTLMQNSAFYACVRLLTLSAAALTPTLRDADGALAADQSALKLIKRRASAELNGLQYRTRAFFDLVVYEAHYARIVRSPVTKAVIALIPLDARNTHPVRDSFGNLGYECLTDSGPQRYALSEIFRVTRFTAGAEPLPPSDHMSKAIEEALRIAEHSLDAYRSGLKSPGVLQFKEVLNEDVRKQVEKSFNADQSDRNKRFLLLDAFANFVTTQQTNESAQTLETRRLAISEVCRFMGVPPFMIFETGGNTTLGSSLSAQQIEFYRSTLAPYADAFEAAYDDQILGDNSAVTLSLDFNPYRFIPVKELADALSVFIQSGQMTPNESRRIRGEKPLPGGDELLINTALSRIQNATNSNQSGI